MGHERIGTLPKSERWRNIVRSVGNYTDSEDNIAEIASQATRNVRSRFQDITSDSSVFAAFKFILTLAHLAKSDDALEKLQGQGIVLPKNFNLYDLAFCIQNYVLEDIDSQEYSSFAVQSIIETISEWARVNETGQQNLFESNDGSLELWRKASNGAGFCELSRLFFSKFTERYLKYFLEREAAAEINNLYDRTQFNKNLETHIDRIAKHAFETSKITQSFAAAWFNKYAREKLPTDKRIRGFLSFAFQKINSELVREEIAND
ncbi:hypothetical protein H8S90_15120 [Olivibacter sp. SDN3]|uniref:hypothetical protein n=1 Tax=Olivibacter sp. SDN3 TaxID=2764720 RepID=UPI0016513321|nr:hypothetical protein [Olivibacter sp. SDN3]QNL48135.1 hypothetical protein H8S90_15120 [Olivibacter sp. SDN3]